MIMSQFATSLEVTEQDTAVTDDLAEIMAGLSRHQKMISPKFFYDEAGSKLFDRITELPEYYPTQTELGIMQDNIGEMVALIGKDASLIEFGSGSSMKTRLLLKHLIEPAVYVPVDISRDHLVASAEILAADFPYLEILPVAADFTQPFDLPDPRVMPLRNIVYFPGSTIGNFTPGDALSLLRVMHEEAAEDGALLIGVDLQKDRDVLERAYNDSAGVTAQFNLNVLRRLNREFGANFDVEQFEHKAFYNAAAGRIEMHLTSLCKQTMRIDGRRFHFDKGETIHTESSHKYALDGFREIARTAGFAVHTVWTDERRYFSLQYCLRT
jgi:dimethylhistidine N-methyltransferase